MTRLPLLDPWFGVITLTPQQMKAIAMHPTRSLTVPGATLRLRLVQTAGGGGENKLHMIEVTAGNPHELPIQIYNALDAI